MTPAAAPRVVVVTGASSGIGLATAQRAAARGDHVVLVARGETALRAGAEECDRLGAASTLVVACDVGDDGAVRDMVAETRGRHGRLDVVVSCAGVVAYGRVEDVPPEVFDTVLRTNLHGQVNVARHVVPVLRAQDGGGALVLIGSVIGHITVPSMSAYALSKWGVRALARHLRVENRDRRDVRIAYVAPGGVDTPIYTQAASTLGVPGRPPPPVSSPERAARQILLRADRPWVPAQLTVANDAIRFGHAWLPAVYDAIVGPLFGVGALDHTRSTTGPGNVLESRPAGNRLRGDQGPAVRGILANLRTRRRGQSSSTRSPRTVALRRRSGSRRA